MAPDGLSIQGTGPTVSTHRALPASPLPSSFLTSICAEFSRTSTKQFESGLDRCPFTLWFSCAPLQKTKSNGSCKRSVVRCETFRDARILEDEPIRRIHSNSRKVCGNSIATGIGSISIFSCTAAVDDEAALWKGVLGRALTRASSATNMAWFRRLDGASPLRAMHRSRFVIGTATTRKKSGTLEKLLTEFPCSTNVPGDRFHR